MTTRNRTLSVRRAWTAAEVEDDIAYEILPEDLADHFEDWHGWHVESPIFIVVR